MLIAFLRKFISFFMAVVLLVPSAFAGYRLADDLQPAEDAPEAVFAVISDIHLTDDQARADMLALGLADMQAAGRRLDALVLCGDNTDGGEREQYELLYQTISAWDPAENVVLAQGNHDTWTDDGYDAAKALFIEYNEKIAGRTLERAYYTAEVAGCRFIVMASDADHTDAYFNDEQLSWLQAELDAACADGGPVFVLSHWPLNYTHGLPGTWEGNPFEDENLGGMGDQSDAVREILTSHENVYLISGHLHTGLANELHEKLGPAFKYSSIEHDGGLTTVNLPSYMYPSVRGNGLNGKGFVFEVYEDHVLIRARCFSGGYWLDAYSESVPIA